MDVLRSNYRIDDVTIFSPISTKQHEQNSSHYSHDFRFATPSKLLPSNRNVFDDLPVVNYNALYDTRSLLLYPPGEVLLEEFHSALKIANELAPERQ